MFLVVGSNGQLGNELRIRLQDQACYVDREELDITDRDAVRRFTSEHVFDAIINCAAYTAVDRAENDKDLARLLNATAPKYLAETGIPLIQISTDYVFDGHAFLPYTEADNPNPLSVYGQTKHEGEQNVLEFAQTAIVLRTAWLYSSFGNNFIRTMLRLGKERESLRVVFDQTGTPTNAGDLAETIVTLLPQIQSGMKGIWHYSNEGVCSWYDFAIEIMRLAQLPCRIEPILSSEYPTPATRPFYSVLNKSKIKSDFGISIPHWQNSLKRDFPLFD